ncbi:peptidoglycan-binding domain-containing protein [Streptacidiphilus melanogenes]|uniref:peptidoglycan-binding domain-containing protein n=1 Tax=Streptacidiphilus melanogenes TaxID=411235 RepID=UPI000AB639A9|nr:peptidoglycan-binding domain-containing protein [Streptacidiphilus melanogenes]
MRLTSRVGITMGAAALALAASAVGAHASTTASWIGDGYPNNTHGVWCVQHSLNYFQRTVGPAMKYQIPVIAEDGIWGPQTKRAVVLFQEDMAVGNLQADGVVGPKTGDALIETGDQYYNGYNGEYATGYCADYVPTEF